MVRFSCGLRLLADRQECPIFVLLFLQLNSQGFIVGLGSLGALEQCCLIFVGSDLLPLATVSND